MISLLEIPIPATEGNEIRMKICDIELTEPDPDLFTIPDDYQIVEERNGEFG